MGQADVLHLLRRTGFGPTRAEVGALVGLDRATVVGRLLDTSGNPGVVAPASLSRSDTYFNMVDIQQWWWERMRTTPTPLLEKMTLFWHGHFASSEEKVFDPQKMWDQNQTLRANALGSFETLFQAVAVDPAMLVYLDGATNVVGSPNENFARESMELFSIGVNQFSQTDVTVVAKAWTGYGLNANQQSVFTPAQHDQSRSALFGLPAQSWTGPQVIHQLCSGAKQPLCAAFIAAKLWSYFAYPNPDPGLVSQLASTFISSGMSIAALMAAILDNDAFYGPAAVGALVRTPSDYMVSAMRHVGLTASAIHPEWFAGGMNQSVFYPPNVSGWHGNPDFLSTGAAQAKASFAETLAWKYMATLQYSGFARIPAAQAVTQVLDTFGVFAPSPATTAALTAWAAGPQATGSDYGRMWGLIMLTLLSADFSLA